MPRTLKMSTPTSVPADAILARCCRLLLKKNTEQVSLPYYLEDENGWTPLISKRTPF